jgi:hypothetical protein
VKAHPVVLLLLLAPAAASMGACGSKHPAPNHVGEGSGSAAVVADPRTELERRRDTACEQVGPKLTACAVADARVELDAGRMPKKEFDLNTAPEVQRKNTEESVKACEVPMSSRQVRVLEVCFKEEQECGPLADCLTHLNDKPAK